MRSDPIHLHNDYARTGRAALPWLLSAIASGFVLEAVFIRLFNSAAFGQGLSLSWEGLRQGQVWQLLSYGFIHPVRDTLSVIHVLFNALCLYFVGREIESQLGTRHFAGLYVFATALGAAAWLGLHYAHGGALYGAWPGIAACIALFGLLHPTQEISLLLLFVPVRVQARVLVLVLLAYDLFGLLFWEIRGLNSLIGDNHSAHLGGLFAGYLYFKLVHQREWRNPDGRTEILLPRWFRKARAASAPPPAFKVNLSDPAHLRAEVDRILDKINSEGFSALTPAEKQLLDQARDRISKH